MSFFFFSLRAEVLVNIAKANTSVFHHRRTNTNLSHASCFLYLPSGFTSFLLSLRADFACVEELDTFNLYPLQRCCISCLHCISSCRLSKQSRVTLVVCTLCILSIRVCERGRGMRSTRTHLSLTHSVCFSLYPSPAVIGLSVSPC